MVGEEANEIFTPNFIAEETEKIIREANKKQSIKYEVIELRSCIYASILIQTRNFFEETSWQRCIHVIL